MITQSRLSWFIVVESVIALLLLIALSIYRWPVLSAAVTVCALVLAALIPLAVWRARRAARPLPAWLSRTWSVMIALIVLSILAFATGHDHLFAVV